MTKGELRELRELIREVVREELSGGSKERPIRTVKRDAPPDLNVQVSQTSGGSCQY